MNPVSNKVLTIHELLQLLLLLPETSFSILGGRRTPSTRGGKEVHRIAASRGGPRPRVEARSLAIRSQRDKTLGGCFIVIDSHVQHCCFLSGTNTVSYPDSVVSYDKRRNRVWVFLYSRPKQGNISKVNRLIISSQNSDIKFIVKTISKTILHQYIIFAHILILYR